MTIKRMSQILTFCGALPFYLLLIPALPLLSDESRIHGFLAYGAVIAAFMAGTLWGLAQRDRDPPILPIISSNALALLAWASLLIPSTIAATALQLVVFLGLLEVDRRIETDGREAPWYFTMRIRITALVSVAYVVQLFLQAS